MAHAYLNVIIDKIEEAVKNALWVMSLIIGKLNDIVLVCTI